MNLHSTSSLRSLPKALSIAVISGSSQPFSLLGKAAYRYPSRRKGCGRTEPNNAEKEFPYRTVRV